MVAAAAFTADVMNHRITDMRYFDTIQLDDRVLLEDAVMDEAKRIMLELDPTFGYSFSYHYNTNTVDLLKVCERFNIATYANVHGRTLTHLVVFVSSPHGNVAAVGFAVEGAS